MTKANDIAIAGSFGTSQCQKKFPYMFKAGSTMLRDQNKGESGGLKQHKRCVVPLTELPTDGERHKKEEDEKKRRDREPAQENKCGLVACDKRDGDDVR
jgi:hypothetical protein